MYYTERKVFDIYDYNCVVKIIRRSIFIVITAIYNIAIYNINNNYYIFVLLGVQKSSEL